MVINVGRMEMNHISVGPLGTPSKKDTIVRNMTKVRGKRMVKLMNLLIVLLHIVILE